jgi:DNA-directed RNA polymerase subunit D
MNLTVLSEQDNKMEFLLRGPMTAFANLLRRYGMGQVPVFAIDKVTFYENSSAMFDEYIAHRIGQVPLTADFSRPSDEIIFTLEAEGPATVFSGDLKSTDPKIKAALTNLPLVKLLEGQNIRLEAKARMGIGRQHAKFQPGLIAYEMLAPNEFRFKVETFLQMGPRELMEKTADTIIERCEELESKLASIKSKEG